MQLVERHTVKKSDKGYRHLDDMAFRSKNLYNATLYTIRQHWFQHGSYQTYYSLQKEFQDSNNPDYYALPAKVSQWVMKMVDYTFKSFFNANKAYQQCPSKFKKKPQLPKYLDKEKGRYVITFTNQAISKKHLDKRGVLVMSGLPDVEIPTRIGYDLINQVRVVKGTGCYVIEIVYTVEEETLKSDNGSYASVDLGVNNLVTVTFNDDKPFIINGRPLKSINQYYNKKLAEYKSCQKNNNREINRRKIQTLTRKRNNKVKDYLHKASRMLVNHLVSTGTNTLVIGKNNGWKQDTKFKGKKETVQQNNQNFVSIPHSTFVEMLAYKCKLEGINVIFQEESYTSQASFVDKDPIPVYQKGAKNEVEFSGKRVSRGLYRTKDKRLVNADVNGSLNILRKAVPNVVFTDGIEVCSTPVVFNITK